VSVCPSYCDVLFLSDEHHPDLNLTKELINDIKHLPDLEANFITTPHYLKQLFTSLDIHTKTSYNVVVVIENKPRRTK